MLEKVAIPIISFQEFDPDDVPTMNDLITMREDGTLCKNTFKKREINKFVVVNKDPIMPYIDYFRRFVEQVEKTVKQQQQTERKDARKEQGITL